MDLMPFTGNPLDRSSNERRDDAWIAAQMEDKRARFLPLWKLNAPVLIGDVEPALMWLDYDAARPLRESAFPILLGLLDGVPHFALDVSFLDEPVLGMGLTDVSFSEIRTLATTLSAHESGILAQARAVTDWHDRHRFCASCGSMTEPHKGGSARKCPSCEREHFPRTDPVVIMVVWNGDRCLLGKRSTRPGVFYSTLAGFIEQGESIEEAVRREVKEESSIEVDEVTYFASQPWPFPSNLMVGCFAHTEQEDFVVDPEELAEARWFTREQVKLAVEHPEASTELTIPNRAAIAFHLLKAWAEGSNK